MEDNNQNFSNDFLIGAWYQVYELISSFLPPIKYCPTMIFTRASRAKVEKYEKKYKKYTDGLLAGRLQKKIYVLDPKSVMVIHGGFKLYTFKKLNENYVIFWKCEMMGDIFSLLSKYRNATDVELDNIINNTPEFKNKKV
ncbi:hypothetical protein K1T71_001499 [Dendrolimus kikuchii]|uniref:Uncharacterized protein n=1 Tax=Dendrolimus kikuchii TaxID=765133 RepID=A0ACC1DIP1_9NEOP|nr:hypothetical protein K1T71_001499 [Dendrolimus kikuchii]